MAGLQQYNFFPTDLLYPRPQPQQASPKPTVLPLQTPNVQDHTQHHQQPSRTNATTPSTSALSYSQKPHSLAALDNNKLSSDPLSWLLWMTEDDDQNTSHSS